VFWDVYGAVSQWRDGGRPPIGRTLGVAFAEIDHCSYDASGTLLAICVMVEGGGTSTSGLSTVPGGTSDVTNDSLPGARVGRHNVVVLQADSGRPVAVLEGHSGRVNQAVFCLHRNDQLVTLSDDRTFKIWDLSTRSLVYQSSIISSSPFISCAMDPDPLTPRFALGTADGMLRFYDLSRPGARNLHTLDLAREHRKRARAHALAIREQLIVEERSKQLVISSVKQPSAEITVASMLAATAAGGMNGAPMDHEPVEADVDVPLRLLALWFQPSVTVNVVRYGNGTTTLTYGNPPAVAAAPETTPTPTKQSSISSTTTTAKKSTGTTKPPVRSSTSAAKKPSTLASSSSSSSGTKRSSGGKGSVPVVAAAKRISSAGKTSTGGAVAGSGARAALKLSLADASLTISATAPSSSDSKDETSPVASPTPVTSSSTPAPVSVVRETLGPSLVIGTSQGLLRLCTRTFHLLADYPFVADSSPAAATAALTSTMTTGISIGAAITTISSSTITTNAVLPTLTLREVGTPGCYAFADLRAPANMDEKSLSLTMNTTVSSIGICCGVAGLFDARLSVIRLLPSLRSAAFNETVPLSGRRAHGERKGTASTSATLSVHQHGQLPDASPLRRWQWIAKKAVGKSKSNGKNIGTSSGSSGSAGNKKSLTADKPIVFHSRIKSSGYGSAKPQYGIGARKSAVKKSSSGSGISKAEKKYPVDCVLMTEYQPEHASPTPLHSGPISRLCYSSDAQRLLTASFDMTARISRLPLAKHRDTGLQLIGHNGPVRSAKWSHSNKVPLVLTCSADRTVHSYIYLVYTKVLYSCVRSCCEPPPPFRHGYGDQVELSRY
jgi:WD40 repeat protein